MILRHGVLAVDPASHCCKACLILQGDLCTGDLTLWPQEINGLLQEINTLKRLKHKRTHCRGLRVPTRGMFFFFFLCVCVCARVFVFAGRVHLWSAGMSTYDVYFNFLSIERSSWLLSVYWYFNLSVFCRSVSLHACIILCI